MDAKKLDGLLKEVQTKMINEYNIPVSTAKLFSSSNTKLISKSELVGIRKAYGRMVAESEKVLSSDQFSKERREAIKLYTRLVGEAIFNNSSVEVSENS